jgi:hypothetical protein
MQTFSRRALFAVAAAAFVTPASARDDAQKMGARDLNVEVARPIARRQSRPINASIMPVGASSVSIGSPLGFRMVSTADGWGSLYVMSASGRTQAWFENVRLGSGQPLSYPRRGLIVRASPPAGDDAVMFVVSRDRLDGFAGRQLTSPIDLQYTHDGLRTAIQDRFRDIPRDRWVFTEIRIRVRE